MYFIMAVEICTVLFVLVFTVREIRKIKKLKFQYFKVLILDLVVKTSLLLNNLIKDVSAFC